MAQKIARIKLIGLGGIGSWLAPPLAKYLNHVVSQTMPVILTLIDGDKVLPNNLRRQSLDGTGENKAHNVAERLDRNDTSELLINTEARFVDERSVIELINEGDMVLLCVDNAATRKLVSDYCQRLQNITVISGGNSTVEEGNYGLVQVFMRRQGRNLTLPLANKYHPVIMYPADNIPSEDEELRQHRCGYDPQHIAANLFAATLILSTFCTIIEEGKIGYDEVWFEVRTGQAIPVRREVT